MRLLVVEDDPALRQQLKVDSVLRVMPLTRLLTGPKGCTWDQNLRSTPP